VSYEQIIKDINQRHFKPIYFIDGDEPFLIDSILKALEASVLQEHERDFNQSILYGKETEVLSIISEAKRFPMMAERVLVIVKEAQYLRNLDALVSYAENPNPQTVLALGYKGKKLDKRSKLAKVLGKNGVHLNTTAFREYEIPKWISSHSHTLGFRMDNLAVQLLADSLGNDLGRLHSEMKKLKILLAEGEVASKEFVASHVGIHKDYNLFELAKALGKGDKLLLQRILQYAHANPKEIPYVVVVGNLYSFFEKLVLFHSSPSKDPSKIAGLLKVNPYFVKDYQFAASRFDLRSSVEAIHIIKEYDGKGKGLGSDSVPSTELLRELIWKLDFCAHSSLDR